MGVVAEIERKLVRLRACEEADGPPDLRTSTMTHVVWAPPRWLEQARRTLAGLEERHPARTILLRPEPGRRTAIEAEAAVRDFRVDGLSREVLSEVIELRLRGEAARHPGSLVLPLLLSDLPAFCRWRGEPPWESTALPERVDVRDRFVVDSAEWRRVPAAYRSLVGLFDEIAVSDLAFARAEPWRRALAALWPGIAGVARLRVAGPRADAELLAGWLASRLGRTIVLTRRHDPEISAVRVDGVPVASAPAPLSASDLLSAELDRLGRDRVYEAAAAAVS